MTTMMTTTSASLAKSSHGFPFHPHPIQYTHNPTQAPRKLTTKRTRRKQPAYQGFIDNNNNKIRRATEIQTKTKTKPTPTVDPITPLLVWDGTQYQLDYNHNHRSISVWDRTTHTNIVYEEDDDDDTDDADYTYDDYEKCSAAYDYAYADSLNMNDPTFPITIQRVPPCCTISKVPPSRTTASHTTSHTANHTVRKPKQTRNDNNERNAQRSDTVHV